MFTHRSDIVTARSNMFTHRRDIFTDMLIFTDEYDIFKDMCYIFTQV